LKTQHYIALLDAYSEGSGFRGCFDVDALLSMHSR
jgi:hypothetical protein